MIKQIDWSTILSLWKTQLWPHRTSQIETHSAMIFGGGYTLKNFKCPVIFLGAIQYNNIVGVNSVHGCSDGSWRTRGLWVDPLFRGKKIGTNLLLESIKFAKNNNASFIWSYPRQTSWKTYYSVGFRLSQEFYGWESSETSEANAYCVYQD